MKKFKGTKGNWIKAKNVYRETIIRPKNSVAANQEIIAKIFISAKSEANENLIAAAPEVLKQLQRALHYWGKGFEPKEIASETIGSKLYLDCEKVINKALNI